jgi:N-acetylneuraminic acid mutarotase
LNKGFNWKFYYREKLAFTQPLDWEVIQSETQPSPRQSHGAGNVGNQMYIFGGHQVVEESFSRKDDVWTFNPSTNNFQQVFLDGPSLPALSRHRVVTVNDKLYSFGGILQDKTKINSIYCFDFSSKRWEELEPAPGSITPAPRCDPVVVAYGSNLIVFGGSVQNMDFPSDIHVFNTLTKQWTQPQVSGEVPPPRIGCTGVVIDDIMYIYGGGDYNKEERKYLSLFTETWALDLKTYKWSKLEETGDVVPTICDFLSSFVIGHHFVVVGGWCTEEPFAFDTVAKRWTMLVNKAPTKINNNDATATVIGNSVYLFGGYQNAYQHHMCKLDIHQIGIQNYQ